MTKDYLEFSLDPSLQFANLPKVSVNIGGKNDFMTLEKVFLKAPTYKNSDDIFKMKPIFNTALLKMSSDIEEMQSRLGNKVNDVLDSIDKKEDDEDKEKEELDSRRSITRLVLNSKHLDTSEFILKLFCKFLSKNIAFKTDDFENINAIRIDELREIDSSNLENLVVEYIAVFFMESWQKSIQ